MRRKEKTKEKEERDKRRENGKGEIGKEMKMRYRWNKQGKKWEETGSKGVSVRKKERKKV